MKNLVSNILTLVRWNDWHDVRIPFVFIVILYFQYTTAFLGNGPIVYVKCIFLVLFSVFFYAFLFLSNDYFDFNQDVRAAKGSKHRNRTLMLLLIPVLFITGIIFLRLSWNTYSFMSIFVASVGYGLSFYYSSPPLRFKEKKIWGIVVGATILRPMCILMLLAGLALTERQFEIILFMTWMEIIGIRTMMFHQIDDYHNDRRAHVRTFVTTYGKKLAHNLIVSFFLPAEIIVFLGVIAMMVIRIPALTFLIAAYAIGFLWTGRGHTRSLNDVVHYRPLFGRMVFFLLPMYLAVLVAIKFSLWFVPIFVLFWQRRFMKEFLIT